MAKSAFVIMPFRSGEEYEHYRAVFLNYIQPPLADFGYSVVRADDIQKSGAITREVILRLAEAELVVADMTDLNPNVFYELGIRHTLRKSGTLLLVDELRTPAIPFDLHVYRVIKYEGSLTKLGRLRDAILSFISAARDTEEFGADNPVHDWLPQLPENVIASASGSVEGVLRARLAALEATVQRYEKTYAVLPAETKSPMDVIDSLYQDARSGKLPSDLIRVAEAAFKERNKIEFLEAIKQIMANTLRPTRGELAELAGWASDLGFGNEASTAIWKYAVEIYPRDVDLKTAWLSSLAMRMTKKIGAKHAKS